MGEEGGIEGSKIELVENRLTFGPNLLYSLLVPLNPNRPYMYIVRKMNVHRK